MLYESTNGDLFGWLFAAFLAAASTLLGSTSTRNVSAQFLFIVAVLVRIALSALSSYNIFLPPDADRLDFHIEASELSISGVPTDILIGHQIYTLVLSIVYQLFGTSIFLGCIVSLFPFLASLVYLLRLLQLLGLEKYEAPALLFFGFAPGMLLYANYTYREPLQILLLMMCVFYGLRYRRAPSLGNLALCILTLFAFASLHSKFFLVTPVIAALLFFWPVGRGGQRHQPRRAAKTLTSMLTGVFAIALSIAFILTQSDKNSLVDMLTTGKVTDYMVDMQYVVKGIAPRTLLPFQLQGTSPLELAYMAPLMLFQYMFAPILPWTVSEMQDLVALLDTALRVILLFGAVRTIQRTPHGQRNDLVLLLLIYLAFSFVAALGTAAVGTAIRHQIKASWILVVLAGPTLFRVLGGAAARQMRQASQIG